MSEITMLKHYNEDEVANLKSGKYSPLNIHNTYLEDYDEASGKFNYAIKLLDLVSVLEILAEKVVKKLGKAEKKLGKAVKSKK